MTKRILALAVAGISLVASSCHPGSGGFTKKNGYEYKIVTDAHGKKAMPGDIVTLHITVKVGDSAMGSTYKDNHGEPTTMRIEATSQRGDWKEGLSMFGAGDSGVIRIAIDTIKKIAPAGSLPPWMKSGTYANFSVRIVSVKTAAEFQKESSEKAAAQANGDDQKLQAYFAQNNIKAQKTPSGLYYTIQKEGSGAQIQKGQNVSVMYTGKTLEGKVFDTNRDSSKHHTDPLKFAVGQHQMIPGMDEGVALLKNGSKATFYIPSPLAYGAQSPSPDLSPNSILVFDVDVIDVKAATPPTAQGPGGQMPGGQMQGGPGGQMQGRPGGQ